MSGTVSEDVCALFTAFKNSVKNRKTNEPREKKEEIQHKADATNIFYLHSKIVTSYLFSCYEI